MECYVAADTKKKSEKEKEAGEPEVVAEVPNKDGVYEKLRTYTLGSIHDVEYDVVDEPALQEEVLHRGIACSSPLLHSDLILLQSRCSC